MIWNFKDKTNKISEAEQKKIEQQIGKLKADVQAITAQLPPVAHVLGKFINSTLFFFKKSYFKSIFNYSMYIHFGFRVCF